MENDTVPFAVGQRIALAVQHAGIFSYDLASMIGVSRRDVSLWTLNRAQPSTKMLLKIADACLVDARWLATGISSPAANAALKEIDRVLTGARDAISPELATMLRGSLLLLEEPSRAAGVCRYCACEDSRACPGGCSWVDDEETICSACLRPAVKELVDG